MRTSNNSIFVGDSKQEEIQSIKNILTEVKLPVEGIENHLDNFLSLYVDGLLVGTIGLETYGRKALLRSLAVDKSHRGKGYGKMLCSKIIEKAKHKEINELFLLTETAVEFFETIGFKVISRDEADVRVKTSEEFKTLCPSTATCMRLSLEENIN